MTYTCLIVDDEPPSHQVLKSHIEQIPNLDLAAEFYNANDASTYLKSNSVDILLLDIQMPEITGIEFLKSLSTKPITIFTTAFRDYAFEGFELGVIDYLLKPVNFERFEMAIRRATDFMQMSRPEDAVEFKPNYEILIKSGTKKILLDYRTIIYAQGLKDYTILHTSDKKYVVKGSVKAFEESLPSAYFLRVHKSFIIARNQIKLVYKNKIELENVSIPIGRSYKEQIFKDFPSSFPPQRG
ncbi:MAG TPA: LytTR family DNA-binding domain-containing protein [Cyclobacteriaceae bacterium]|nr:LytTR family DNA-binding domain-containing protein [Cyclobacteriaceae bacterium]